MASTIQLQEYDRVADHYGCHGDEECDHDCVGMSVKREGPGRGEGGDKTNLEVQVDGWKESEKSAN